MKNLPILRQKIKNQIKDLIFLNVKTNIDIEFISNKCPIYE